MVVVAGNLHLLWKNMRGSGHSKNMGQHCGDMVTWLKIRT